MFAEIEISFKLLLLLSDIMSMKHEVCTKVNFHNRCKFIPITKMLNLLLLSHEHVCKISRINSEGIPINSIVSQSRCKKKFIGGDHTKTECLG